MAFMGIDIGTSGCKAAVYDSSGSLLSESYRAYEVRNRNREFAELAIDEVIDACFFVIGKAASLIKQSATAGASRIETIGISCQGEAFTALDDSGTHLIPAMVSSDTRAAAISQMWPEAFGTEKLYRITGHTPHPMFTIFKLIWLKKHQPEIWNRTARFLCFEDLLQQQLGVEDPAISFSLAGRTMLFDISKASWSSEILDAVGLDVNKLSRVLPSGSPVGTIGKAVAEQLGLPANTMVVTGGHDQPVSALGSGAVLPGEAMISSGTVECICPVVATQIFGKALLEHHLCTYHYTLENLYTTVAFSLTGGNLVEWFRRLSGEIDYDTLASEMPAAPTVLDIIPYFTPSGTPFFDLTTPGVIGGLRLDTTRGEVMKGLLEAVAMEMRLNLSILRTSGIPVTSLTAVGGGVKNSSFVQLKSDVLGTPVRCLEIPEAGCRGTAILGAALKTGESAATIARKWAHQKMLIEPRSEHVKEYEEKFERYKELYAVVKNFYSRSANRAP